MICCGPFKLQGYQRLWVLQVLHRRHHVSIVTFYTLRRFNHCAIVSAMHVAAVCLVSPGLRLGIMLVGSYMPLCKHTAGCSHTSPSLRWCSAWFIGDVRLQNRNIRFAPVPILLAGRRSTLILFW